MNEIEKTIRYFRNLKDKNFVVLNDFRKEIEMKKAIGNDNYYGSTLVYENRDNYYSIAISALEKQLNGGWISVSERLPNEKECNRFGIGHPNYRKFLCTIKIANYEATTRELYFSKIFEWKYGPEDYNEHVIAWRPLPEPYKEEGEQ